MAVLRESQEIVQKPPTVVAPIASARSAEQLADLLPFSAIELTTAELSRLSAR